MGSPRSGRRLNSRARGEQFAGLSTAWRAFAGTYETLADRGEAALRRRRRATVGGPWPISVLGRACARRDWTGAGRQFPTDRMGADGLGLRARLKGRPC